MIRDQRNTICVEDAGVLQHTAFADGQYVLRLTAPHCATRAQPGSFIHIQCADDIPMRRPLSIMRANAAAGWIEVLYKVMGQGLERLAAAAPGASISILGPIGNGFEADADRPTAVLIGGGVGIPPLIFLAEHIHAGGWNDARSVAFFGSELPFPFNLIDSAIALPGAPVAASQAISLLDEKGIPSRLATASGFAGCYAGFVTELAREWLQTLSDVQLEQIMLYACGPEPMLAAVAKLAHSFGLPSQLCLEEFMACGVGGCAGCAVEVQTPDGPAMKRVCVDGPVFAGDAIYTG
jgi:dihydroorotate dehydrogenase electron transfer subunit